MERTLIRGEFTVRSACAVGKTLHKSTGSIVNWRELRRMYPVWRMVLMEKRRIGPGRSSPFGGPLSRRNT
jgi:hypothetical protein